MFYNISTITSNSYFYNYNSINIKNMSYMFYNCQSIIQLPDISILNTKNVNDMSFMFYNCLSLKQLPDISKWNIENVVNTNNMFENCFSLSSLPNISVWNTKKIKNMDFMFKNCKLLSHLSNFNNFPINDIIEIDRKFKEDLDKKNEDKILRFIKNLIDYIFNSFYKIVNNETNIKFIFAFIYLFIFIIRFFIPFKIDATLDCINNPIKYFNSLDGLYNANITFITEFLNVTEPSIMKEISENKEKYVHKLLNFTYINGNLKFDFVFNKLKIYIFFLFLINFSFLVNLVYIIYNRNCNKFIKLRLDVILLTMQFSSVIFLILIEVLYSITLKKLISSIDSFYERIKKIFNIQIPEENEEEYNAFIGNLICSFSYCLFYIGFFIISLCLSNYYNIKIKPKKKLESILIKKRKKNNCYFDLFNV